MQNIADSLKDFLYKIDLHEKYANYIFCKLHYNCTLTDSFAKKYYGFSLYSNSSKGNHRPHSIGA